nr:7-cyano-7-deazaguanine synthase [Gammaproteobacteria bacterium]
MDTIFGFCGRRDDAWLAAMGATLAHRGAQQRSVSTARATLAYRGVDGMSGQESAGVIEDAGLLLAVSGAVFDQTRLTLKDLLARYRREGVGLAGNLRGAFLIAIADADIVHVIRDPGGERTAYFGLNAGSLVFAGEPKGVLGTPGFSKTLRPGALAQYLTFSFVPGRKTMLNELSEIPAGHTLSWCAGDTEPHLERYFCFEKSADVTLGPLGRGASSEVDWPGEFRTRLQRVVTERLDGASSGVGVFLSGGLDSSVVTAELARQLGSGVPSFSIHFGSEYAHELDFAREVAERWQTDHHEVLIRPKDFLPRLRRMIWHLDDPIGDPITMPNFELASHARQ